MLEKHSITLMGHKTSISIESEFWEELKQIARVQNKSINEIISSIDIGKNSGNLSSSIRIFIIQYLKGLI
ncbi:ribbon-helix-helix domain-containing protein [bacterium]|nr:ribbon-helix-helix domain-containing protein [bacterium]